MPTATTQANDTKKYIEALRVELKSANERMDNATKNGFKMEDGGVVVTPEAAAEFKSALSKAREVEGYITGLEFKGRVDGWLETPAARPSGMDHLTVAGLPSAPGGVPYYGGAEYKSIGQRFVESKEFKERNPNGTSGEFTITDGEMTGVEYKDIHSGSIGTFTHPGFGRTERAPMVSAPMRVARVRDLFPQANTNAVLIEYVEELGYVEVGDNAAAPVAERLGDDSNFGLKPKSNIRFNTKSAPIKTLAHWVPAHRNTLSDEPQLRSIIDVRLMYGLKLEEDRQILLGDGLGENLLGLLNTPGVQQYPGASPIDAQDTYVDAARRAMTRVMLAEYEATGLVVHPYDWERMELTKDDNGQYVVAVNVAEGARKRLWQVPVIATPAIPEGTGLTGAFGLGAQVFDRMQGNIRTAEQHADFFVRNAVVVLAEERTGLAVWRPEAFVEVGFLASVA